MNIDAEVIHRFVDTLAWPAILVAAFFAFRKEFKGMFGRLSKLSFGDVSLELTEKVDSLEKLAVDTERQRKSDDVTEKMVDEQLSNTLPPSFSEDELIDAISHASKRSLNLIYLQTKDVRRRSWQAIRVKRSSEYDNEESRLADLEISVRWMRRTIPIFRALTKTEHRGEWHRYHAQLGYALKDSGHLSEALAQLGNEIPFSKDTTGNPVSPHYRFNWTYCRVRLDNEQHAKDGNLSDDETVSTVKESLLETCGLPSLSQAIRKDPEVAKWLSRNKLDWETLDSQ
jgi:hypothetical protein